MSRSLQSLFCRFHYVTGVFTFGLWSLETRFAKLQSYFFDYRRRIWFDFAMATLAVVVFRLQYHRERDVIVGMRTWSLCTGPDHKHVTVTNIVQGMSRFKELRVSELKIKFLILQRICAILGYVLVYRQTCMGITSLSRRK